MHALIEPNADGSHDVRVGFEDLFGGGDEDLNDVLVRVSGAAQRLLDVDVRSASTGSLGVLPVVVRGGGTGAGRLVVPTLCLGPSPDPRSGDCTEEHGRGHRHTARGATDALVVHFNARQARVRDSRARLCLIGVDVSGRRVVGCDSPRP